MPSPPDLSMTYAMSPALVLQSSDSGRLVATHAGFSEPVNADELIVLTSFGDGRSVEEAIAIARQWASAPVIDGFRAVAEKLCGRGLLVQVAEGGQRTAAPVVEHGFGSVLSHVIMLQDAVRVFA